MKIVIALLFSFSLPLLVFSQVGINNTNPNATLDITASNVATPANTDGILIPRVDEFPVVNPTINQDGMMLFVTGAGVPAKGFYYWDQGTTSWAPVSGGSSDADWFEENTTVAPSSNAADIFTDGNVGIGLSNVTYPLHIESATGTRTVSLLNENTGSSVIGIYNTINESTTTSSGSSNGLINSITRSSQSTISGVSNNFQNSTANVGSGYLYGYQNSFGTSTSGTTFGLLNRFQGTTNTAYGINNIIGGPITTFYGVNNNNIAGANISGDFYGLSNTLTGSDSGDRYGVYTSLAETGTGDKYGEYISIPTTAGGTHYGIYADVQDGAGFAGYFLGRTSLGAGVTNRYIMPASDGTAGQVMTTNGSGNVTFQNVAGDGTGTDDQQIDTFSFNTGTNILTLEIEDDAQIAQTVDLSTLASSDADWFEVGTTSNPNDINDNIYTQGRVGIGALSPQYDLQVDNTSTDLVVTSIDYTYTGTSSPARALWIESEGTGVGSNIYGAYIQTSNSPNSNATTAVYAFNSAQATSNTGVNGYATGSGGTNTGVLGRANDGSVANYGGSFLSDGAGAINYGVFARATGATTNWAAYFGDAALSDSGNVYVQDALHADGTFQYSDGSEVNGYVLTTDASGNSTWIDPSTIFTDTDNQQIDTFSFNSGTNLLTLEIEDDAQIAQTVDLSSLSNNDFDWLTSVGDNTPTSINDNIYTRGNVSIGGTSANGDFNIYHSEAADGIPDIVQYNEVNNTANDDKIIIRNTFGSAVAGDNTAIYNDLIGNGSGDYYGMYNLSYGTIIGNIHGMYNSIFASGNGIHYGTRNYLDGNGDGAKYGTFNSIGGLGIGAKYGTYTSILASNGGTHFGIYANVLKSGSYAGYFLGSVSIGTTAGNSYLMPASRGSNGDIIQTDATGNLSWIDPATIGDGIGTDDQTIDNLSLSGTTLRISLEGDGAPLQTVNLSSLAGDDDWTDVGADIERQSGDVYIGDDANTNNNLYINNRIIDWDDAGYYLDPNSRSIMGLIQFDNGTAAFPSITFSETNTGFFRSGANGTAYSANGSEALRIQSDGTINVGDTAVEDYKLSISGLNKTIKIGNLTNTNPGILIDHAEQRGDGLEVNVTDLYSLASRSAISTFNDTSDTTTEISRFETGSGDNFGVKTEIPVDRSGIEYGIYSSVLTSDGKAGYFLGDVAVGTTTANTYTLPASRGTANQIMQTDASGNVSWADPGSSSLALARITLSANQVETGSGITKVNFDTEDFDIGGGFNLTTDEFEVPADGVYRVHAQISMNSTTSTGAFDVRIRVDGNQVRRAAFDHPGSGAVIRQVTSLLELTAGQVIDIAFLRAAAITINSNDALSYFEIEQL